MSAIVDRVLGSLGVGRDHYCRDDLAQEGLLACLQAKRSFDPSRGAQLESWMHTKATGAIQDALRRERRQAHGPDDSEMTSVAKHGVGELPWEHLSEEEYWTVHHLYLEGMSLKAVSAMTGWTHRRVLAARRRALRKLAGDA